MEAGRGVERKKSFGLHRSPPLPGTSDIAIKFRDSARSAPRNIAEGFGRYYPSAALPFYYIALGSLNETFNHLIDRRKREFLEEEEFVRLRRLTFVQSKRSDGWSITWREPVSASTASPATPAALEPRELEV
jgi:four helix bundle protein